MGKQNRPSFFTVEDVATNLGVSTKTVRRHIISGALKSYKIGRSRRISDEDYRAFLAIRRE